MTMREEEKMMKYVNWKNNFKWVMVLVMTYFICFSGIAFAYSIKTIEIVNHTGYSIKSMYLYPSGNDAKNRGSDLVKASLLENGKSIKCKRYDYRYYDLKIVFPNDVTRIWEGEYKLDLSGAWRITIYSTGIENNYEGFAVSKN